MRRLLITAALILSLAGGSATAQGPFSAQIQAALRALGLLGAYGDGQVPVWSASAGQFQPGSGSAAACPGSATTEVLFNNAGVCDGNPNVAINPSTGVLTAVSPTLVTPTLGVATATRLGVGIAPSATIALYGQGPSGDWAARFNGSAVAGNSFGLQIVAGTNASDYAVLIASAAGTNFFSIAGNGYLGTGTLAASPTHPVSIAPGTGLALYEAYTDGSNYSRFVLSTPVGGPITFTSEAGGSGTARPFRFTGGYIGVAGSGLTVANVGANSCGTTAATIAGAANSFEITIGATAGTQCRVTFPVAAPTRWNCSANNTTTANLSRVTPVDVSNVDVLGTFVAGDVVSVTCLPR